MLTRSQPFLKNHRLLTLRMGEIALIPQEVHANWLPIQNGPPPKCVHASIIMQTEKILCVFSGVCVCEH